MCYSGWRIFTFHNVSINTAPKSCIVPFFMYFTFHNVSINTKSGLKIIIFCIRSFTFHNVSINTFVVCKPGT